MSAVEHIDPTRFEPRSSGRNMRAGTYWKEYDEKMTMKKADPAELINIVRVHYSYYHPWYGHMKLIAKIII